ncbi:hypothetical protein ABFS83_09G056900 [Erythranthe nasuta]
MQHHLSQSTWRAKAGFFSHYPRFLCIFRLNAHQSNLIATRLIGHYHSNFSVRVFRLLRQPNIFPFNACNHQSAGRGGNAASAQRVDVFFSPQGVLQSVDCVRQVHFHVLKSAFVSDSFVCNGLLMVYAKVIRDLRSARHVFDDMPHRNFVFCMTCLISGYAKLGSPEDALNLFTMMLDENLLPESDTMVSVLSACSSLTPAHLDKWVKLTTHMLKECCNLASDYVNIVLVYLYGKCRKVEQSRVNFDQISDKGKRSILSWNTMIGTYVQNGCALEALTVFKSMMENYDCCPNHVTMVSILSACAEIGDLDLGIWVHTTCEQVEKTYTVIQRKSRICIDRYVLEMREFGCCERSFRRDSGKRRGFIQCHDRRSCCKRQRG